MARIEAFASHISESLVDLEHRLRSTTLATFLRRNLLSAESCEFRRGPQSYPGHSNRDDGTPIELFSRALVTWGRLDVDFLPLRFENQRRAIR
jgi:hypothetical protein